ncbi:MAG: J domain-containing protein [Myxococcales bacterium]
MAEVAPELDCRQCGLPLLFLRSPRSPVGYYRCPRCDRLVASSDAGALEVTATPREQRASRAEAEERERALRPFRDRLDRWLAVAEGRDPFAALGLRPGADLAEARERFHDLALQHHPDRGGDAERMRKLIEAYDQVRDRLARAAREAPAPSRPAARPTGLVRRRPESWARAPRPAPEEETA